MLDSFTDFLRDFFGDGTPGYQFPYFSIAHLAPIIIMIALICVIYRYKDQIRDNKELDIKLRAWIGFIVSFANASWYWLFIGIGTDVSQALPLTICETVMFFAPFLLFTKSQHMFDVFYFWTIAGSTNALLTPAVLDNFGPTKYRYYQFWVGHTGIFIVIFYCIFVLQMRINFKSLIRSVVWIMLFGVLAIYVNSVIEGANYLFLSGSVAGDSILDILPTHLPTRFAILTTLCLILFILIYLPWYFLDKKRQYFTTENLKNVA